MRILPSGVSASGLRVNGKLNIQFLSPQLTADAHKLKVDAEV